MTHKVREVVAAAAAEEQARVTVEWHWYAPVRLRNPWTGGRMVRAMSTNQQHTSSRVESRLCTGHLNLIIPPEGFDKGDTFCEWIFYQELISALDVKSLIGIWF